MKYFRWLDTSATKTCVPAAKPHFLQKGDQADFLSADPSPMAEGAEISACSIRGGPALVRAEQDEHT